VTTTPASLTLRLLTMAGTAARLGLERVLTLAGIRIKANTSKKRTYSLFRQGCMYYQALPNMPEAQLRPLIERFAQLVCEQLVFREAFGII